MAGGIDWFRWHHGSVSDLKFPLVAKRAGASVAEVIAVWACVLEAASMNTEMRGALSAVPDYEALDCALGMPDGRCQAIFEALCARRLIDQHLHIVAWPKRQPKRERDDDSSTARVQAFRERQRHETPSNANDALETPREEESRGEIHPTSDEVGSEEACASIAIEPGEEGDSCPHKAIIELFHRTLPTARRVRDWTPSRQALLRARWREDKRRQSLAWWEGFFLYVGESKFLIGATTSPGRKPFDLGLEWLCKAENFAKVREGAYHDRTFEEATA